MKKLLAITISSLALTPLWAMSNNNNDNEQLLNKIILPLQAEQWLTTKTALVNVSVNAAVTDKAIEKVRSKVLEKLQQIAAKGEWHILAFNRTQDRSGLESIQISAQARLDQLDLAGLRDKAKSISLPGETYTIDTIDFTPSDEEVRTANTMLRKNIYDQAKSELETLNNLYPNQKYYLHKIDFIPQQIMPMMKTMARTAQIAELSAPAFNVGNKIELIATIELASSIEQKTGSAN